MFLCRNDRTSLLRHDLLRNRLILFGVAAEIALILLIGYTTLGNLIFQTAPISLDVWLFILPFAAAMVVLEELRKGIARHRDLRGG